VVVEGLLGYFLGGLARLDVVRELLERLPFSLLTSARNSEHPINILELREGLKGV
jgi:hypothetical protein